MKTSISARANADILEEQYNKWTSDPQSVGPTWAAFFEGFELGVAQPPEITEARDSAAPESSATATKGDVDFYGKVVSMIYNYRGYGHTQADINPLDSPERNPRLAPESYDLSAADMEREIATPFFHKGEKMKLRDLIAALEETYSGYIGFEFVHIHDTTIRHWVRKQIENKPSRAKDSVEDKRQALKWLLEADAFENFLAHKFIGEKRFSIEGGEGAMVILNSILEDCPRSGVNEIEMGMAHRGRLNVMANFVAKPLSTILYEFTPNYIPDIVAGDGDVKYHLGYESIRKLADGEVRVSLAANPSHLEAVNAIVEGKARARQRIIGDDGAKTDRTRVLPILIHGDAAFPGQGSVAELLNISKLQGYRTGGTIHLIINNQIGFTTMPADARSSPYATDLAKAISAPILHVNGERPMELRWAALFALEFRQKFGKDIVIDMYCYRRHGHNEADQAAFTQPGIYRKIKNRLPVGKLYQKELLGSGELDEDDAKEMEDEIMQRLEQGYEKMREHEEKGEKTKFSGSTAVDQPDYEHPEIPTGVDREMILHIGKVLTTMPEDFNLHPTLNKRFIPRRTHALEAGGPIDWSFAESLSFGSLLMEGFPVRLSGQDCRRGTFSQRHAVFYDTETRNRYIPLTNLSEDQAKFCVYNSLLSEFVALAFEYGYSLGSEKMLNLWEAQFGDFANGAQVIIDQFISSAESKWQTPSDLVMLLPHGYEGMGPEHSSARLERFLQLCAEDNLIVANLTTPAQYFHILRRHKKLKQRKPLILMTPKSLLTRAEAVSSIDDLTGDTRFHEVLPDTWQPSNPAAIRRVILCSGKVFYDLAEYREEHDIQDTVILRVEQLYPFHKTLIKEHVQQYPNAEQIIWTQEEPKNMGAWSFIAPRLESLLERPIRYAGRRSAASPSEGSKAMHKKVQNALVKEAFAG